MLKIAKYPDLSSVPAQDVVTFDAELRKLIDDMAEAMYAGDGVGLAAPQVGVDSMVMLIDPSAGVEASRMTAMINPSLTWVSPEIAVGVEGCLSLPGWQLQVPRHVAVEVEYNDAMGTRRSVRCIDLAARIVQHELDHLAGLVMLNRAGPLAIKVALQQMGARQ